MFGFWTGMEAHIITPYEAEKPATSVTSSNIRASVQFNSIRSMHNVIKNGKKGLLVYLDFKISGMKGRRCSAVAHFFHSNGSQLKNLSGGYGTGNGQVSTSTKFTPGYDNTNYNRMELFIPYEEMHLNGSYNLKFRVSVFDAYGKGVGRSEFQSFKLSWKSRSSGSKANALMKEGCG